MRRCLHACLIGVLTLSLSTDAARACWFLRHGGRGPQVVVIACPPVAAACGCSSAARAPVDPCGVWHVVSDVVVEQAPAVIEDSCDCCGVGGFEADQMAVASEALAPELAEFEIGGSEAVVSSQVSPPADDLAIIRSATEPTLAAEPVAAPQPTLAAGVAPAETSAPAPAAVPALAPTDEVRQAVALGEPAKAEADVVLPAEPPMEEDTPAEPEAPAATEDNIFDEVDRGVVGTDAVPGVSEPAATGGEPSAPDAPPAEEPAAPADPFDAAVPGPREPVRRWIDMSGGYAVVGMLRAVRDDGVCVLQTEGRTIEVPLAALSEFDRGYATAAAARFAKAKGPETRDTVGL